MSGTESRVMSGTKFSVLCNLSIRRNGISFPKEHSLNMRPHGREFQSLCQDVRGVLLGTHVVEANNRTSDHFADSVVG
eukprot:scaffold23486_cov99-Amphora_coffeaeformis.AAC.1